MSASLGGEFDTVEKEKPEAYEHQELHLRVTALEGQFDTLTETLHVVAADIQSLMQRAGDLEREVGNA